MKLNLFVANYVIICLSIVSKSNAKKRLKASVLSLHIVQSKAFGTIDNKYIHYERNTIKRESICFD